MAAAELDTTLDATLTALADPIRRHVVELLQEGPRRAGDLAAAHRMSAPAMSRHLRVLRASGLVDAEIGEGDARARVYRLRPEPLAELHDWLNRMQAFWRDELEAFKAHVEQTGKGRRR